MCNFNDIVTAARIASSSIFGGTMSVKERLKLFIIFIELEFDLKINDHICVISLNFLNYGPITLLQKYMQTI